MHLFICCLCACFFNLFDSYIRRWFLIDLLTSLPLEFVLNQDSEDVGTWFKALRVFRTVRLLKLLRFFKMLRLLNSLMRRFFSRYLITLFRLCRFVCVMIIFAHFCACGWFAVGDYGEAQHRKHPTSARWNATWISTQGIQNDPLWEQYSYSWYWSVVTLFTTGYGDITATNTLEQWAASVCILIGTCFFAYFVGAVGTLLADGDRIRAERNQKIEEAQQFCVSKKLPKDLSHAIITHTKYHCKHNYLFDESSVLQCLPLYLR